MDIVFVGAGRLATHFASALHENGHCIRAVYSRTMASAEALCKRVGGTPTNSIAELPLRADAYIVAVKDSVLPTIIASLAKGREQQFFFHTAGSVPLSVFEGELQNYGVIYPMQTFSKERYIDFTRVPLFIEGCNSASLLLAHTIAGAVSSHVVELTSEERRYLHLSAVFACNFSNHCYALAERILTLHGMDFRVLLPLIEETAAKVETMAPTEAQTGPAIRYDENVINAQKALLADEPLMQAIYEQMSKSIHQLAND